MKNPRMTRDELENLLHTRESEICELKNKIEEMNNVMYLAEGKKFGEGYQEAVNKVCDVLVEMFGKENKE